MDFLGRLASITPPPRVNLLRFHGVIAPICGLRARNVTEREPEGVPPEPEQVPFDFAAPATHLDGAPTTRDRREGTPLRKGP